MMALMMQTDMMVLAGTLFLVLLIAVIFYIKYDLVRLGGLTRGLRKINIREEELPPEQKERMDTLLSLANNTGNRILQTVWKDYHREYTDVLKGEIVPDVSWYFNEKRLIDIPCARRLMERVFLVLFILGIAGALLYPSLVLLGIDGPATGAMVVRSLGISLLLLAAVSFIIFLFKMVDVANLEGARKSLWEFHYRLSGWLNPISEPTEISLLVESQRQNSRDFKEAVDRLEERLDNFETETLVPLLGSKFREAIEQNITPILQQTSGVLSELSSAVVEKQDNGMKELAQTFTEKVTAITAERLNNFTEKTTEISNSLENVVSGMSRIQEAMSQSAKSQEMLGLQSLEALDEAGRIQGQVSEALKASIESVRAAESIAGEMRAYAVKGMDKADAMAHQSLQLLESNVDQVKSIQTGISELAYTLQRHSDNSIARVSEELTRAVENYTEVSAGMEAARVLHGQEMDEKIGNLFDRMLESNALMIDKLTDTVAEVSLNGGKVMEQIQAQASEMYSDLSGKLNKSNTQISGYLARAVTQYAEVSTRMEDKLAAVVADVSLEGSNIVEKAGRQASDLYSDLLNRMDKSIDSMGDNIAASMRAAMGESVEIVEKLAARTAEMKDLYDSYFTRIGEQSAKTLDDLDFSIQKVLASFSTETAEIISKITNNSSGALEFFDKGIKDLVENMEENSRSMGLYAKEINIDVAELSANLKGSVQEFTNQIQGGINRTFDDFDKGLGEVTLRLATILDSIRDSVEALQRALKNG